MIVQGSDKGLCNVEGLNGLFFSRWGDILRYTPVVLSLNYAKRQLNEDFAPEDDVLGS
jgi:hypothetical protein